MKWQIYFQQLVVWCLMELCLTTNWHNFMLRRLCLCELLTFFARETYFVTPKRLGFTGWWWNFCQPFMSDFCMVNQHHLEASKLIWELLPIWQQVHERKYEITDQHRSWYWHTTKTKTSKIYEGSCFVARCSRIVSTSRWPARIWTWRCHNKPVIDVFWINHCWKLGRKRWVVG